jgi:CheY-like chemotaxis protein
MGRSLDGRSILVVEGEPVIALDIAYAFECAGAHVVISRSLNRALALVDTHGWSAAVLDPAFDDGDSARLCEQLKKRDIPYVLYSAGGPQGEACRDGVRVFVPAGPVVLVRTVENLVQDGSHSH